MGMLKTFLSCLGFLTIIPSGRKELLKAEDFGKFPGYFPHVGLALGFILFFVWVMCKPFLPQEVIATLLVTLLIVLTRGFHLDGLADAADALLSHKPLEQKLLIMKDSHQGTFGVLAIVLTVVLKIQLLSYFLVPEWVWVVLFWPMWSRMAASVVAVCSSYIRSEGGLGQHIVDHSGLNEMAGALFFGASASLVFGLFNSSVSMLSVLLAVLAALTCGAMLTLVWKKTLGGVTGDLLGATIELCEVFVLLVLLAIV